MPDEKKQMSGLFRPLLCSIQLHNLVCSTYCFADRKIGSFFFFPFVTPIFHKLSNQSKKKKKKNVRLTVTKIVCSFTGFLQNKHFLIQFFFCFFVPVGELSYYAKTTFRDGHRAPAPDQLQFTSERLLGRRWRFGHHE